ncbi:hypothetical protein B0H14DRAFT_3712263 [Mycena olivaceomarginata]|nr:hypothetical protein B0H14DRAFT_3712263 [Mycena olivaceomarginata]
MSETAEASTIDSETLPSSPLLDDATSDTEVEPPSPGGSTKGLYVHLDFTRFGMTPPPRRYISHRRALPPTPYHWPTPAGQKAPLRSKRQIAVHRKRYGHDSQTNRAPAAPVKTVPRDLTAVPATPVAAKPSGGRGSGTHTPPSPIAIAHTRTTLVPPRASFTRGRALSIRSFKSKGKARAVGVENLPPLPVRATSPRPRMHSFSGYLADSELADDEDETDAEMTAIQLEALGTVLKLNELFVFANVDPEETGIAL